MTYSLPEHPLISVVMPVYNAERYVAEAITSILVQTHPHFEFIIVDDGSTDGSADIVRAFAERESRIRPLFLPHGGLARALNAGIELAQGDLIARMDADDISLPERLGAQLDWMRRTGVDVCGCCWKAFGDQSYLGWVPKSHLAICYELVLGVALLHPTVMLRADIAHQHLYNGTLLTTSDSELWARLAPLYRLGNVQRVLLKYRVHAQQNHVRMQSVMVETLRRWRRCLLQSLFPQVSEADCALLDRIAEKEPLTCLADLERAGTWLVRLAQTPDAYLRRRMANRWRTTCRRSARLGLGGYHLYRKIAPEFGADSQDDYAGLWLSCALRLEPETRSSAAFHWLNMRLGRFFRRRSLTTEP